MTKQGRKTLLEYLKKKKKELKKLDVKLIASYSDVDVVVEFDEGKATFENVGKLVDYLELLFGRSVDILTYLTINSIRIKEVKENIKRDIVYVEERRY